MVRTSGDDWLRHTTAKDGMAKQLRLKAPRRTGQRPRATAASGFWLATRESARCLIPEDVQDIKGDISNTSEDGYQCRGVLGA